MECLGYLNESFLRLEKVDSYFESICLFLIVLKSICFNKFHKEIIKNVI